MNVGHEDKQRKILFLWFRLLPGVCDFDSFLSANVKGIHRVKAERNGVDTADLLATEIAAASTIDHKFRFNFLGLRVSPRLLYTKKKFKIVYLISFFLPFCFAHFTDLAPTLIHYPINSVDPVEKPS